MISHATAKESDKTMRSIKTTTLALGRRVLLVGMLAMCGMGMAVAAQREGGLSDSLFALQLRRAEHGDRAAQVSVAERFREGRGVAKDLAASLRWYRAAAEAGHAGAAFHVGESYERGLGVAKDPATAVQWYERAALGGNADARAKLVERAAREQAEREAQERAAREAKERAEQAERQRAERAQAAKQQQAQAQKAVAAAQERQAQARAVAVAQQPPVVHQTPGAVLASLRQRDWQFEGKPVEFLPSERATCIQQGDNGLTCFTQETVARVGDRQLRYLVKSEVQVTPEGRVQIRYRHYVLRLREAKGDEPVYAGPQAPKLAEGLQEPPLALLCEATAGTVMTCADSAGAKLSFTEARP